MAKQFQGKKNMDVVTWAGNADTQTISGLDFSPDLVWIKQRDGSLDHQLFDTVRGAGQVIESNNTDAEVTRANGLTSFASDGFTLGADSYTNNTPYNYVAWCWDAGDETVEIAADSIPVNNISEHVYSDDVTTSNGYSTDRDATKGFDGQTSLVGTSETYCQTDTTNGSVTWTPNGYTFDASTQRIIVKGISSTDRLWVVGSAGSASDVTPSTVDGISNSWEISASVGSITSITIQNSVGLGGFSGISVDGSVLIDNGVSAPGVNSIASTVRVNPEAGFSVVKYKGAGVVQAMAHGLDQAPKFMIVKRYDSTAGWYIYHESLGNGNPEDYSVQFTTNAPFTTTTVWNNTKPTDKVFTAGSTADLSGSGGDFIAYCWSEIPGYSKGGQYSGNGTTSNFVYTEFKPQYLLVKRTDTAGYGWQLWDNERSNDAYLQANASNAEAGGLAINAVSNGFQIANSNGNYNASGGTYIFMAFAEKPMFRPQRVELEFQDTQDFDEILEGDTLTEYTLAGPGEGATVESKDETTNKVIALTEDISTFTTDGTRSMTKPVTDPSNKRWTWSGWIKRSAINKPQYAFKAGTFVVGFNEANQLFAGNVPVDVYVTTQAGGSALSTMIDNSTLWTGQDITSSQSIFFVPRDRNVSGASAKAFYTGFDMYLGGRSADNGGVFRADGVTLANIGSYGGQEFPQYFTYVGNETAVGGTYDIPTQDNVGYLYLKNYNSTAGSLGQLAVAYGVTTTTSYTDTSTWMHVTVTCDTISGEGIKLYVNGDEVTDFWSQTQPPLDYSFGLNTTDTEQNIGVSSNLTFSGYTADVQFYDGQVVTPDNLVYNDPTNENRLSPAAPSKWFGTRGYHLDFGDRRSPDLFTQDVSGNDDNWSSSNVSVVGHSEATTAPVTEVSGGSTTKTIEYIEYGSSGGAGWLSDFYLNDSNGQAVNEPDPSGTLTDRPGGVGTVNNPQNAFDTNTSTYAQMVSGSTWTIPEKPETTYAIYRYTPSITWDAGEVLVYAYGASSNNNNFVKVVYTDGTSQIVFATGNTGGTTTFSIDPADAPVLSVLTFSNNTNLEVASVGDTVSQGEVTGTVFGSDVRNKTLTINGSGFSVNSTVTLNSTLTTGDVDSVVDTPNNYGKDDGLGGEQRGNYGTWNASDVRTLGNNPVTLTNGNLTFGDHGVDSAYGSTIGNFPMSSGKWYWEITIKDVGTVDGTTYMGIAPLDELSNGSGNIFSACPNALCVRAGVNAYRGDGSQTTGYLSAAGTPGEGSVYGFAMDVDNNTFEVYLDGVSGGTFPYTMIGGRTWVPFVSDWSNNATEISRYEANFGASPFKYPAPVGYKTMNTNNIEDGLVVQGNTAMDTVLYTGNGGTQTISGLNFSPDLVWIKDRSGTQDHRLYDTVREANREIYSNSPSAAVNNPNSLTGFNTDGFNLGTEPGVNGVDTEYVAWAWDAGDNTPALNTTGTLASTVKVNPTTGFSIATYTGAGAADSIGHGLGVAPKFVLVKGIDDGYDWKVYHSSLGAGQYLILNSDSPQVSDSSAITWNGLDPTSSVINLGSGVGVTNSGSNFVTYSWSEVPGYSQFGGYTGNGSVQGPFIHTGFKPAWLMIKRINGSDHWYMYDNKRDGVQYDQLTANIDDAEYSADDYPAIDVHSNGFQLISANAGRNANGGVYVYMAFAELPQQYLPQ